MTPDEMIKKLSQLEKAVIHNKSDDIKTKYQVVSMFRYLRKLIQYQAPMMPINISDDRHKFECPRCGTKFDSEDVVDDFYLCYVCGQRWKEDEEIEERGAE